MVRGGGTAKRSAMKDDDDWTFVRHLTPVVSSFMRQVVTPPTRARRRVAKDVRRVERVSFHVHVIDVSNQWNDGTGEEEESASSLTAPTRCPGGDDMEFIGSIRREKIPPPASHSRGQSPVFFVVVALERLQPLEKRVKTSKLW